MTPPFSPETLCAQGAPAQPGDDSALVPPIIYSATFAARNAAEFAAMASQPRHARYYTRYGNPLHEQVAAQLVALEGGGADTHDALVTASGMGAVSLVLLGLLKAGDHVVAQTNHYMGSAKHFSELLPRFGVRCTVVDQTDLAAWQRAITPGTRLVVTETPVNPTCALTDLAAVAALARAQGALSVCDNTFASPINQQPLALGVDLVVHSATKYLGGHHDITAGAVVASRALIDELWSTQICLGATLGPMDAWLLLRGLRTLALRVRQHNASALALAQWLERHPNVERVFYPGLRQPPTTWAGPGADARLRRRDERDAARRLRRRQPLRAGAEAAAPGGQPGWCGKPGGARRRHVGRHDERRADARGWHRTQRGALIGGHRGRRRPAGRSGASAGRGLKVLPLAALARRQAPSWL